MKKILLSLMAASLLNAGGGDIFRTQLMLEQFELQNGGIKSWDGYIMAGFNINKIYLYSEGENSANQTEVQFSHAITPFWDIQVGVERDKEIKSKNFAVMALSGLAPYWIETRTKLLLGDGFGVDFDFSYETLFSQRTILTTRVESRYFSKSLNESGNYKGLNDIEIGFRLRYEFKREFAPYIGISYTKNFSNKKQEEGSDDFRSLLGLRFWF